MRGFAPAAGRRLAGFVSRRQATPALTEYGIAV